MSLRRLLRKVGLRLRRRPPAPGDLYPSYGEYLRVQTEEYRSHEEDVERWSEGLRRFVGIAFADLPRDWRVLDCACGDGVGLDELRSLGFRDPLGVELCSEKARRARRRGFRVEEADMHDLSAIPAGSRDAILCSHTLEHAFDPSRALAELTRALVPGGLLLVVLPYPDPGPRNELAHPAKYELGTDLDDEGAAVRLFCRRRGLEVLGCSRDGYREPELWLRLRYSSQRGIDDPQI